MRKIITVVLLSFVWFGGEAKNPKVWKSLKGDVDFLLVNDSGRNGYYDQKPIAETMGRVAEAISPDCIVAAGDVHHFEGVESVNDPLWMTNYELIYSHPKLMVKWLPVLGNHEWRGNTDAVIAYSDVSRRWCMTDRYYTKVYKDDGVTVRIVMIDTTPIIDSYRNSKNTYTKVVEQDYVAQMEWLDSVLASATEDWIVVVGHHPIYAHTSKGKRERIDMQNRVNSVLTKYGNVDMYLCGHIHNFQHIKVDGCNIDYVVNSSASLARSVKPIEGTQFCSPEAGFSVVAARKKTLRLHMLDKKGRVLHTVERKK